MGTKPLVLDGAEIVRSKNFVPIKKIAKKIKKIYNLISKDFNMKMMFNGLDWPFELLNSRYIHETL
jgi:hypothetical protein